MAEKAATPKKKKSVEKVSPETRAAELKVSTVGDFKKRLGGLMELPSGLVIRAKNPGGLNAFLDGGTIPNALMGTVTAAMEKAERGEDTSNMAEEEAKNVAEMLKSDPEAVSSMLKMIDSVAIQVFVEPQLHPVPEAGVERDEDLLYVDEVPTNDKQFLLKWVTSGADDLAPFRK